MTEYWKLRFGLAIRTAALRILPSALSEFLERSDHNGLAAWSKWYETESKDASMKALGRVMQDGRNKYIDERLT